MAGSTKFYGMAYFDFGDRLDAPLNVKKEIDRFVLIDTQLYGLYNVFGNGVINGWTVTDNGVTDSTGISISVSSGTGIIKFIATETVSPVIVDGLPPNSTLLVYAALIEDTVINRVVDFTVSTTELSSKNMIQIAEVVTGNSSVKSINNDIRDLIGFKEIIKEEIDSHKHRGMPSKIDLAEETKNQLPGSKIQDFDAAKITSGTFGGDRIPILDHSDLENSGQLTHAALDSFVRTLSENNRQLLGEVASTNLLKLVLFHKYDDVNVDEHFINELAIIPGISPDEFIDTDSSSAYINFDTHCISGLPPASGEFVSIKWANKTAFNNAFKTTNINIIGDSVILDRSESSKEFIDDFEDSAQLGLSLTGFSKEAVIVSDSLNATYESADTLKTQGFFSGKFTTARDYRAVFTKTFSDARDWSRFDTLSIDIKTISVTHGPVFAYFVNDGSKSDVFLLLSEDEITDSSENNDFVTKVFDIIGQDRSEVTSFVIFTDDTDSGFEFFIDSVFVNNNSLFKPQGTVRFRFNTSSPVTFHSLFFDAETENSTSVRVRAKVANSSGLLNRSGFTLFLKSGEVFALPGSDIEIEVTLLSSEDNLSTPKFNSLELRLITQADANGFDIISKSDWSLGDTSNVKITPTIADFALVELGDLINVGGMYYSNADAIIEIDDNKVGERGFSGPKMPISPIQAKNWSNVSSKKFEEPVSVARQFDQTYIIADRDNDRILQVDNEGNLVKGFASVDVADEVFYPMCSVYNPETEILTVVVSQPLDSSSIDVSAFSLFIGSNKVPLSSADVIRKTSKNNQIIEIKLTSDKAAAIGVATSGLFLNFESTAFGIDVEFSDDSSAIMGFKGMAVFVGDLTYMDDISSPIFCDILENGNWIVCNSTINFETDDSDSSSGQGSTAGQETSNEAIIASILEFDPVDLDIKFSSSKIVFSDFSLGSIVEQSDTIFVVAGLVKIESSNSSSSSSSDSNVFSRTEFRQQAQEKLANYRGTVTTLDRESGKVIFRYNSPDGLYASDVDIDEDGNFVVAESAFSSLAGRVIVLDNYGNIIRVFGHGSLTIINDVRSIGNGNYLLSL